jgi:ATP-dependent Clp protease ATP-binding subunit ClpC
MFERFTERARQVVVLAQDEARALGHAYIGTEHLLLGLLREQDGIGGRALGSLGFTLEAARDAVRRFVGEGSGAPAAQLPFSPRAKKALELALREAIRLGHEHIGTEHILLGLGRQSEGAAAAVALDAGVTGEAMRDRALELIGPAAALRPGGRRWARTRATGVAAAHPCWEYRIEDRGEIDTDWLDELGSAGWELVSVVARADGNRAIFKRPTAPGARRGGRATGRR